MKKTLLLAVAPLLLISCNKDYYENDERIIIEGKVISNNLPLQNAEVRIYPVYNVSPNSSTIEELTFNSTNEYADDGHTVIKTKTNTAGIINTSVPRNVNTDVYAIKISYGYNSKYYGYISYYNINNYHVNLGTLNY